MAAGVALGVEAEGSRQLVWGGVQGSAGANLALNALALSILNFFHGTIHVLASRCDARLGAEREGGWRSGGAVEDTYCR
jgi:hypothetical protein